MLNFKNEEQGTSPHSNFIIFVNFVGLDLIIVCIKVKKNQVDVVFVLHIDCPVILPTSKMT